MANLSHVDIKFHAVFVSLAVFFTAGDLAAATSKQALGRDRDANRVAAGPGLPTSFISQRKTCPE